MSDKWQGMDLVYWEREDDGTNNTFCDSGQKVDKK